MGFLDEPRKPGPLASHFVNLYDLARILKEQRERQIGCADRTLYEARCHVFDVLIGIGGGDDASHISVYEAGPTGPRKLLDEWPTEAWADDLDDSRLPPTERLRALGEARPNLMSRLDVNAIAAAKSLGLHLLDALMVFNLPNEALGLPTMPAVPDANATREAADGQGGATPTDAAAPSKETAKQRRRRAMTRLHELERLEVDGARLKVAAEFGVDVRTIGKWMLKVETEETEQRKRDAQSRLLAQLGGGDLA